MNATNAPDTGIEDDARAKVASGLAELLSDTFTLYVTTQGFHWNVVGPQFNSLHALFEEQYIDLRDAADEVAERIRALGIHAPGSFGEFLKLSTVRDGVAAEKADDMVSALVDGHETIARKHRELVSVAEDAHDVASADLVTARIAVHEKAAWMLRSLLA